jgi:hypothetical protein
MIEGQGGDMITARTLRARAAWTVAGLPVYDIASAVLLGGYVIGVACDVIPTGNAHFSTAAALGVLPMVVPVAWRRRWPLVAAAVITASTLLNWLLFGSLIRCGVALPAIFLVAFAAGARCDWALAAAGLVLCAADVLAEGFSDPRIGTGGLPLVLPLMIAIFATGRVVRSRTELTETLRRRSAELRGQREQTARLAVQADRARITADLDGALQDQLSGIAGAAATGLRALAADQSAGQAADHAAAQQALASIEHDGRGVLRHLRDVLGTLEEPPPSEPQPTLARLSDLLSRVTTADARLTVEGSARVLPAGLELSGYRIVEHLLLALQDEPGAVIDVQVRFCPDALELHLSGPPARSADLRAVLAAARQRASLHGGTVDSRLAGGVRHAMASLPLISGHA